ncbi:MAG: sulfatase-like hydrolase/transferase, partial [Clostridia bacterium]|nr:sulfatase-like hydrolase/transferase [Clostridia bacterium]
MRQVVLIMTDTQRKDMLGCYNKEKEMHTPNLDKLASQGLRYDRAYTCQPVCGPARSSIFTGTFPHTNGMLGNSMALNQQTKTIGQRLSAKGIKTAYVGKWHLDGGDYFGNGVCPDGWDPEYWYDMRNYLDEMSESDRFNSRQFETALNEEIPEEFTYAHKCSNRAIDFIKENKDNDFMLVVSYDEPHHPFLAPGKYYGRFRGIPHSNSGNIHDTLEDKPEHIKVWHEGEGGFDYSGYGLIGCNSFVDGEIGRVLDAVQDYADESFIIYTSDHGSALGAHGINGKGPSVFEEITNIPLIYKWKGNIEPGTESSNPASHIDIVPTVLEYFGFPQPESLEGTSVLKEITGEKDRTNDYVFMEFTRYEIDHDGFGGYQPLRAVTESR